VKTANRHFSGCAVTLVALLTASFNANAVDKELPMKTQISVPAVALPAAAESKDPQASRKKALVWRAVVKVVNPDDARAAVEKQVRLLKGFPTYFNDGSIQVKIPPEALSSLTAEIKKLGMVLEKSLSSEDLTLRIAELEGMLKSKRDIMERTRKFLDSSDVPSTLDIERTMTGLVFEIEQVRGQLRVLYDRSTYAVVDVSFQFRERDKIVYVQSPFEWLNTVDLGRFVAEF
jgi:Domain of unknown function (DUF4349)